MKSILNIFKSYIEYYAVVGYIHFSYNINENIFTGIISLNNIILTI